MNVEDWKMSLGMANFHGPGKLITKVEYATDMKFAHEIKTALFEIGVEGLYCFHGVPHFAIMSQMNYDREAVLRKYKALWNQGLCMVMLVITKKVVRVFSLAKSINSDEGRKFEDICLIEDIRLGQLGLKFRNYIYGAESGRIWNEKSDMFDFKERIDQILLDNLREACQKLENYNLSMEEAQAILIQTMFIAYLEDRGIINRSYIQNVSNDEHSKFSEILESENYGKLENLFKQLRKDFNGDLFVTPCSFDRTDSQKRLPAKSMKILSDFRKGNMELSTGQMRLFGYDFRFIPVELISSVYDRFLTEDKNSKKKTGSYYSPIMLVDSTLSSIWKYLPEKRKGSCNFLDPACGSGIFLVRCFQQLCELHRSASKATGMEAKAIEWEKLIELVKRVQGRDVNGTAIRIAVFSLYIAMLDESSPKDIRKLIERGRLLPKLWGHTLVECDFFDVRAKDLEVDVVLGNPPWSAKVIKDSPAYIWCKENNRPIPNSQLAWAFVWKTMEHVGKNGLIALLLPATDILFNSGRIGDARITLFSEVTMKRVINYSDFRMQIFKYSTNPVALLLYDPTSKPKSEYKFEYWSPKADRDSSLLRHIRTCTIDKSELRNTYVLRNNLAFDQYNWMRSPARKLFAYLDHLPKMKDKVRNKLRRTDSENEQNMIMEIGRGFQPPSKESSSKGIEKGKESKTISKLKYLAPNDLTPFSISSSKLRKVPWTKFERFGHERAYTNPRVLVNRGVKTAIDRFNAAYSEKSFSFRDATIGISCSSEQAPKAKLLTGILNSRLAIWYVFHRSGSYGVSRPKITQEEFLEIPFPFPEDFEYPDKSKKIYKKIIKAIENNVIDINMHEVVDKLIYKYFCLTDEEIAIIEDTCNFILPSIQPVAGSKPPLWENSNKNVRNEYAIQLKKSLREWFCDTVDISIDVPGLNEDFAILRLELCDPSNAFDYEEHSQSDLSAKLNEILSDGNGARGVDIGEIFDIRIFKGDSLYIIKPLQMRYWLKSTAIADADDLIVELEMSLETSYIRRR